LLVIFTGCAGSLRIGLLLVIFRPTLAAHFLRARRLQAVRPTASSAAERELIR